MNQDEREYITAKFEGMTGLVTEQNKNLHARIDRSEDTTAKMFASLKVDMARLPCDEHDGRIKDCENLKRRMLDKAKDAVTHPQGKSVKEVRAGWFVMLTGAAATLGAAVYGAVELIRVALPFIKGK